MAEGGTARCGINATRGGVMAIKLAELGVGEVVTLLKADLGTELGLIDTARSGDSLVLAVPAAADYYDYPNPVLGDGAAHVEVFEGTISFDHKYSDVAVPRATYDIDITVRLTFITRDGDTPTQKVARMRRYAVGVFNVFSKKPTLGDVDDAIQVAVSSLIETQWITEGENEADIAKGRVTVELTLTCEEN